MKFTENWSFYILCLLVFPTAFLQLTVSKLICGIIIILYLFILLIFRFKFIKFSLTPLKYFLIIYFAYRFIISTINLDIKQDYFFNEVFSILQLFGCIAAYLIGTTYYKNISVKFLNKNIIYISFFSTIAVLTFLNFLPSFLDFYNSRIDRFSSLSSGANYTWVSLLIPLQYIFFVITQKLKPLNYLIIIYSILLSIISLILSGSKTSTVVIIISILLNYFLIFRFSKKFQRFIPFFIITVTSIVYFLISEYYLIFEDLFSRIGQLNTLFINGFSLAELPTYAKRLLNWNHIITTQGITIFGIGLNKSQELHYDNTYLATIIRFGIIGISIELSIIFGYLFKSLRIYLKELNFIALLTFITLIGVLISGWTSSVMYELKTPYIIFGLLGIFDSKYSIKTIPKNLI